MAKPYLVFGTYKIVTECSDLEQITHALNETARQFGDIMEFSYQKRGYMKIENEIDLEIPINETEDEEEFDEDESYN